MCSESVITHGTVINHPANSGLFKQSENSAVLWPPLTKGRPKCGDTARAAKRRKKLQTLHTYRMQIVKNKIKLGTINTIKNRKCHENIVL